MISLLSPTLDVLGDIGLHRLLPVGIGENFFAVEVGDRTVVTRQLQRGELRILRNFKAMAER
jgi:hypothetical protein